MPARRIPDDLRPNALARLVASGIRVPFDLTVSNPTRCGIPYPSGLLEHLADPAALVYEPDARGSRSAREAVARHYRTLGAPVDPDRVVLAASSSEAYSFLFKVLAEPGDAVLVPRPSYPLLEHLARLDGLRPLAYRLDPGAGWQPDPGSLPAGAAGAILAVHPNNPTGSYLAGRSLDDLATAATARGAALIVDEVFLEYPLDPSEQPRSCASLDPVLTFTLGGLSKMAGLPQLKLSWIVVSGPDGETRRALERLEFVADQYLSVGTPIQLALPALLEGSAPVRRSILERCRGNLSTLERLTSDRPALRVLRPQGGWSVVVRFPVVRGEEDLALQLLERHGVLVQPGYFFDFDREGYLVVSLLPEPVVFEEGVRRLVVAVDEAIGG